VNLRRAASRELRTPDQIVVRTFARLDSVALGCAIGAVAGASVFAATVILLIKGGDPVGPNLSLLNQYILYYSVTWKGSLIGAAGGFVIGFACGWAIAVLRNLTLSSYMFACAFWARLNRFLDDV
jgi:hypothetical protein